MADQKITELPIKTSTGINLTDYLLGIDSAEGYQMLVSDIAKKIVEDYAGSTLAGNTQSIADAFTQLQKANIFTIPETVITENTDLNTLNAIGTYRCLGSAVASTLVNSPITNEGFILFVTNGLGASVRIQIAYSATGKLLSMRRMSSDGSNAIAWTTYANKVEMDAVTQFKTATITPSTGFESAGFSTFSITQCGRLVVINGYISNLTGLSTSASTEIATFSNVSLPTTAIKVGAIYSAQAYEAGKNAYISFGSSGKILVRLGEEVTNGKVLYLSASYLV